jgi:RNA polymerase sigma-70 factor (ECF subfamily)
VDEDAQLAKATAAGDAAAFSQLVKRHEGAVRRFLLRLSGHAADDLAQEVFIQAWRLGSTWRGTGTYKSWLMGIAWTQFLSARRGDQRRAARESNWENEAAVVDATVQIDVQRALAELGERERAAAILCFAEGCSHSEAATIMRLPLGTLKSVVARARTKLAERLEVVDD